MENLRVLCRGCNAQKGPRLPGETLDEERERLRAYNRRITSTPEWRERLRLGMQASRGKFLDVIESEDYRRRFEEGMSRVDRQRWAENVRVACWENPERNQRVSLALKRRAAHRHLAEQFKDEQRQLEASERLWGQGWTSLGHSLRPRRRLRRKAQRKPRSLASRLNHSVKMRAAWARKKAANNGIS